ncbi:MAG: hypothetical protein M3552_17440 [Planctomycetota bacterium]|nr:hypothetical protein [Planctomycetaceae bacterium]MDQ3332403.1 hypothetical protein [Planctomycetota bacterium]
MTPTSQIALKVIVERAVRPVRATLERKKRMREELLAHVTEVLDEEVGKSADAQAAIAATARRLGNADEIAAELQRTVPAYDRFFFAMERITLARPEEGVVRRALRWAVFVATMNGLAASCVSMPVGLFSGKWIGLVPLTLVLATLVFGSAIMTFQFVLLGSLLRSVLFVPGHRSPLKVCLVSLGSLLLPILTVFLLYLGLTGDVTWSIAMLGRSVVVVPLIPLILFFVTWKFDEERKYLDEWASLPIE